MFVKPKAGLKVRHNVTRQHIPETGIEVPEDSYWLRRLRDGDVVKAEPEQTAKAGDASSAAGASTR